MATKEKAETEVVTEGIPNTENPLEKCNEKESKPKKSKNPPQRYNYKMLLSSKEFKGERDLIAALIAPDEVLSVEEVKQRILDFLKREVR